MLVIQWPGVRHCIEGVVLMVIATVEDYGEDTCWLDFVMNGHLLINYDR